MEATLRKTPGVLDVGEVRLRWIGHQFRTEREISVSDHTTVVDAYAISHAAEHDLIHAIPRLTSAIVHAEPHSPDGMDHHGVIRHHRLHDRGDQGSIRACRRHATAETP